MVVIMGRPPLYDERRVVTAVRLPASVHSRLREAARARDVSANLLVTRAVCDFLDRLSPPEAALRTDRERKSSAEVHA